MKTKFVLLATAGLAFGAAPQAMAQTAPPQPADTTAPQVPADAADSATADDIVVTGFRASLASAIQQKRSASAIVDSISSEDIGKFPEQNLAESLQRITGVQISRSRGEGQNISIRGLSPDFNQINLNGRTLPSPTGSRSFDFTILSSDFINGLDVYKTPTADMEEGGLAGTVNIRTLRPRDITGLRLSGNVEGLYEGNSKKANSHVAVLFADRLLDDKLSIIAGVDYSKRRLRTYRYEAFGLESAAENPLTGKNLDYNRDGDRADTFLINHAASYATDFGTRERLSGILSLGYQVTDTFNLWAEGLKSRFTNDIHTALNAHRFTNISDPNGVQASKIDSNGIVTFLDSNGVDHRNNGRPSYYKDTLDSYAVGGSWANDGWHLDVEASKGKAKRLATDVSLEVIARASVSEDISIDPDGPAQVAYSRGYDPLNRANWRALGLNGTYKQPTIDRTKEVKFDLGYDFDGSLLKSIKVGGLLGRRQQDVTSQQLVIGADQLAPLLGETYNPAIEGGSFAAGAFMRSYDFPDLLGAYNGSATFPTAFLSSDPRLVFDKVSLGKLAGQFALTQNLAQSYSVRENTLAGYARADFGTEDNRLSGNIGVRVVRTKQTSNGFAPDFSLIRFDQQGARTIVPSVTATSVKQSYTNALPSLNVRYKLTDEIDVRFGAARVLSRPTLSLLAPNTNINANVLSITGGNPTLKPFISDQLDLSAEWYFSPGALLSAAVFYKDVKNYIANSSTSRTLSIQQVQGGTRDFVFTVLQPSNAGNPKIKGFEVGYQQPLTFLPAPFDGFGIIANYTYVTADKISASSGSPPVPLPGVSKNNYNLVGYYEKGPFGIRLSYNYRDQFVVDNFSYFGDGQFTNSYAQFDLSSNLKISNNIEVNFDILNIGNTPVVNVDRFGINRGYEDNGRRFTLGARFKL